MAPVRLASLDPDLVRSELHFGVRKLQVGDEVASIERVNCAVRELNVSRDTAYSDSPAASRASALSRKASIVTTTPARNV
jgi:hypothetical protein